MSNRLKAHIALLLANVIYGINFFVVKEVVPGSLNPYALSMIRAVGALFFLWISGIWFKPQKVAKKDVWTLIIGGILGVTINQTLLITGLNYTSSINASIIMTTNPLFVLVISMLYLRHKITGAKLFGIIIGASGAILVISSNGSFSLSNKTVTGDLLVLANAIMYAAYLVWTKPIMAKYDSMTVMRWMFFYGSIFMLSFGGPFLYKTDFAVIKPIIWGAIFFIVFGATFLTYLFNVYGLKYVNPTTVSVYIYVQPIIASIMAVWIKNDAFTLQKILAMICVFIGVYFVSIYKRFV